VAAYGTEEAKSQIMHLVNVSAGVRRINNDKHRKAGPAQHPVKAAVRDAQRRGIYFASILASLYLLVATYLVFKGIGYQPPVADLPSAEDIAKAKTGAVAVGVVVARNDKALSAAQVTLEAYRDSNQKLASRDLAVNTHGLFLIHQDDLPKAPQVYAIQVKATGAFFMAGSNAATATVKEGAVSLDQTEMRIRVTALDPLLTFLLCLPGIFGLLVSVLHLSQLCPGTPFSAVYAAGTSYL
jgi:hypothetical protein